MTSNAELLGFVVGGNISDHLRGGRDADKFYQGTRMFSPGTKVYLGEAYWGMGGEKIHVVGLRRISKNFVNCAIHIGTIDHLRTMSVYSSSLWSKLEKMNAELFRNKADAAAYLLSCSESLKEYRPDKLVTAEKSVP